LVWEVFGKIGMASVRHGSKTANSVKLILDPKKEHLDAGDGLLFLKGLDASLIDPGHLG
jgi:hypothetical protein